MRISRSILTPFLMKFHIWTYLSMGKMFFKKYFIFESGFRIWIFWASSRTMEIFLNLGLWAHFSSLLEMVFIFEFQMIWGIFSTKNFQISIKFFGTRFLTLLPFFSEFHDFGVVGFVLIVRFHLWIDCGDLECARKGKTQIWVTSWSVLRQVNF